MLNGMRLLVIPYRARRSRSFPEVTTDALQYHVLLT